MPILRNQILPKRIHPRDTRTFLTLFGKKFSPAATDYLNRLQAAGLRVGIYDAANAALIDRLVGNGGNFWPDSGAFNAMAGYLYPTLGTLIPLHPNHDAGTLNAFVTGDWNAVTGLKGDGSTKYVDSNRAGDADGQNDISMGAHISEVPTLLSAIMGWNKLFPRIQTNLFWVSATEKFARINIDPNSGNFLTGNDVGLFAASRNNSANYLVRDSGAETTLEFSSETPVAANYHVFQRNLFGSEFPTNARLPFYHIGPNLNGTGELAELDAALTEWQAALASA